MKRLHMLSGTVAILVGMIALSNFHGTGFDLLMSTAPIHNLLRSLIVVTLVVLALTTRPRTLPIRIGLGVVAGIIIVAALSQTFNYALQPLDAMIYVASATVFLQEALESEPVIENVPQAGGKLRAA